MGTLRDYVNQDLYNLKDNYTGNDFIVGKSKEAWIKPVPHGDLNPPQITILVKLDSFTDDTLITVSSSETVTLYRGDVLNFVECLVVIADTTVVNTSNTNLPVLPLSNNLVTGDAAVTYGMIPVLSIAETDNIDFAGTDAEAQNNIQGIWKTRRTVIRDGSIEIEGALLKTDPAFELLKRFKTGNRPFYFESRYHPFVVFNTHDGIIEKGEGIGAYMGLVTIADSQDVGSNDNFVLVSYSLKFNGIAKPYKLLEGFFIEPNNYCPLDTTGFFIIDYEVIPKNDHSHYCPLDITGFYDFDAPP